MMKKAKLDDEIKIELSEYEIIEKEASKFGNAAHIVLSKDLIGKKVKIITGKGVKKTENYIIFDLFKTQIFDGEIKSFGTGAHVLIPKEIGKEKIKLLWRKDE